MTRLLGALLIGAGLLCFAASGVEIRVIDAQGGAVAGAPIELRPPAGAGKRATAFTDARGVAKVLLPPGTEVRVSAAGFEPFAKVMDAGSGAVLTVELSPARVVTTVDVIVQEAPGASESSQTTAEIERGGARTVFDAVEKLVPSVSVTRRGVMGYGIATNGTGGVSIRGVGGQPNTGVLVVVDGRPDMQGLMGHPLPDFYSLSDAGTVSVTEGPASVLYGSNAMGGAIEVKPSRVEHGMTTRLTTSLGSFLTGQHRLSHGARRGRGYYSLATGVAHTRGERSSADFRSQDASATAGYDVSASWKASMEGRFGHFYVEDPGPVSAPLQGSYARVGRGGVTLNLDNATPWTWGYLRAYSSWGHHIITDGFRSVDSTGGIRAHQNFRLGASLAVDAGTDIAAYGGRARNVRSRLDYGDHRLTSTAGFTRAQWTPGARWRFHGGVRYDHNSLAGAITAPEAGATFRINEAYWVSAKAGRGFRNPTLRELFLFPAPNPLLEPERMWNYQVSLHGRPRNNLSGWVTFYYADLENMIVTLGRFPNLALDNSGRALNRGWEASAQWKPSPRATFRSGYAYLRSTNLAPYVPAHKLNYSLDLDAGKVFLHLGGMTVGPTWADARRSRRLGGYTAGTLKATLPFRKRYSVFTMVDNLLDRRYEVVAGYPMPGINAAGGLTLTF